MRSTATERLDELKRRIKADERNSNWEVWFWKTGQEFGFSGAAATVRGFSGTAPIIFTGFIPSKGRRGGLKSGTLNNPDEVFYRIIAEHGLQDAHITDLFKVRSLVKDTPLVKFDPVLLGAYRDYFREEASIINPEVVVMLGDDVVEVLYGWRFIAPEDRNRYIFQVGGRNIPALKTVHPSATRYRTRAAARQAKFSQTCADARSLLDQGKR
jgi:uracil-DNA glycosylase